MSLAPHDSATETEILFEILLTIGTHDALIPMLETTLYSAIRLLNATGAAVFQQHHDTTDAPLSLICQLPYRLDQTRHYQHLLQQDCLERCRQHFDQEPQVMVASYHIDHHIFYIFRLQGFGLLMLVKSTLGLADHFQQAFAIVASKLSAAALACLSLKAMQETKQQLVEARNQLHATLDAIPDLLFEIDTDGRFLSVHSASSDKLYLSPEQFLGQTVQQIMPPEVTAVVYRARDEALKTGHSMGEQYQLTIAGEVRHFEMSVACKATLAGQVSRLVYMCRDITERRQNEARLKLAASVFSHAREGIMITAADGTMIDVNQTFTEITGYDRDDMIGQRPDLLKSDQHPPVFYQELWQSLLNKGHWYGEIWNKRKNGERYASIVTISSVQGDGGNTQHYVALFTDITQLKQHQQRLEHIAHYDALTGLPNRVLLSERLQQAMLCSRRREESLAIVYLDLDGFKSINDHYGHSVGDQVLVMIASRMQNALREVDTLARIGGDEFVAVLGDLMHAADCDIILKRLLEAAAAPIQIQGATLQLSASLGVTIYPDNQADAEQLLRHADQAMYQAKQNGKNCFKYFDAHQANALQAQHAQLEDLRHALDHHEFVLFYQPKVNMKTGQVVGVEALIRWQHPQRGLLQPADFLPLIEGHHLSCALDEWVQETALAQMAFWHTQGLSLSVSVNIGARFLQQADFMDGLKQRLQRYPQLPAGSLLLEVLETSALNDIDHTARLMHACRDIGVRFALDDFGTGYSSLTYLKRLPADQLKIDRSFVRDMLTTPDDLSIVDGVIGLAKAFRREVIAEGVESVEHGEFLLPLGCELAQGYGIARPMPAADIPVWVATWRPDPRWTAWDNRRASVGQMAALFAEVEYRAWAQHLSHCIQQHQPISANNPLRDDRFQDWYEKLTSLATEQPERLIALQLLHQQFEQISMTLVDFLNAPSDCIDPQALLALQQLEGVLTQLIQSLHNLCEDSPRPEPSRKLSHLMSQALISLSDRISPVHR
jgi:diguanylate cyclase (GGDEF)-like protein/PAS domain S-box-containing protein